MAYVAEFEHDIFVSYASVDNELEASVEAGWISLFRQTLEVALARKLGRSSSAKFWFDKPNLTHTGTLGPEIEQAVGRSAILLVFLSSGYLASDWCRMERELFLRVHSQSDYAKRIFLIHIDDVARPHEFANILGFKCWQKAPDSETVQTIGRPKPNPELDRNYYSLIADVAQELANVLSALNQPVSARPPVAAGDSRDCVYLAETTDDLEEQRDLMRRFLDQSGIPVLPKEYYPRGPDEYRAAVERDMAHCRIFVQLASALPGKRPAGLPQGYVRLQHECAAGLRILQWRSPDLSLATVTDPSQREFLEGPDMVAVGIDEFKRMTLEEYRRKKRKPLEPGPLRLVFVSAHDADLGLARELVNSCQDAGYTAALAARVGTQTEMREDFERWVSSCDAILLVYESCTPFWVRDQALEVFRSVRLRSTPPPTLSIYQKPPPPAKTDIDIRWPGIQYLRSPADLPKLFSEA